MSSETQPAPLKPESRPNVLYGYVDLVGRSYAFLTCPFCAEQVKVFIWSLAGSGKRCKCGAIHSRSFSTMYPKKVRESK